MNTHVSGTVYRFATFMGLLVFGPSGLRSGVEKKTSEPIKPSGYIVMGDIQSIWGMLRKEQLTSAWSLYPERGFLVLL